HPVALRPGPPALPDPDLVHRRHGLGLDGVLRRADQDQQQRALGLDPLARTRDRLLLRPDRLGLLLVLPAARAPRPAVRQDPVAALRAAAARRADPVRVLRLRLPRLL